MSQNYTEIFSVFQKYMDAEDSRRDAIRTAVKEIELTYREILTLLQKVHKPKGLLEISTICTTAREQFEKVQKQFTNLKEKVPFEEFYRYHEFWKFVTHRLVFLAAFIVFLESGRLIEKEEAASFLGICSDPKDGFHLDLEDFLLGLLSLAEELTRLSLNCATQGDYSRPVQIAEFVSEMNVGFRLLNLKNDSLRKKFDGLKYNLKRVEEVVYDLSIRGLKPVDTSVDN